MTPDKQQPRENKKTGCITWLLLAGFALVSLSGWLRMAGAANNASWMDQYGVPAVYLEISGAVWGLVALIALAWILLRRRWYTLAGIFAAAFLAITYWADRLLLGKPYGIDKNIPFAVLLTLALLAFTWVALKPMDEIRKGMGKTKGSV